MASTLAGLNARRKVTYSVVTPWPPGTPQPLTKQLADYFFSLLSTNERSLLALLQAHPELPPFRQLDTWRANNKQGFADKWRAAGELRAHFLAEKCLDIQHDTDPKNAHSQRVKFDVLKWMCAKLNPTFYGDKPATTAVNVAVGFNVSTARLEEIRSKLDVTRNTLTEKPHSNGSSNRLLSNTVPNSNDVTVNGETDSIQDSPHSISDSAPLVKESRTDGNNHD